MKSKVTKSKLMIEGVPNKVTIKEDGSAEMLFKINNDSIYSLEKKLGDSIYLVSVPSKMVEKIKDKMTETGYYKIVGAVKATVTKKGIPLVILNPLSLKFGEFRVEQKAEKKKKAVVFELEKGWYSDKELVEINVKDVEIVNKEHLTTRTLNLNKTLYNVKNGNRRLTPLAVRKLEDSRYELIAGIKSYCVAKIMDIEKIEAYITELDHEEFVKEHKIETFRYNRKGR